MNDIAERQVSAKPTPLERAFVIFQRMIACYCLMFGVLYWIRLIGLYDGPLWRFDLMPVHWQVAAVTLAVVFPFAAIGLWMLASWGPVMWAICALIEIAMYGFMPDLFGRRLLIVASHALVVMLYVGLRTTIRLQKERLAAPTPGKSERTQ